MSTLSLFSIIKKRSCLKLAVTISLLLMTAGCMSTQKVGVIFVVHGGFSTYKPQYLWDASAQMFSYDPNHPVYQIVIWNKDNWGMVLGAGNAPKEIKKYAFEYQRIGGVDPLPPLLLSSFPVCRLNLKNRACCGDYSLNMTMLIGWQAMTSPIMHIHALSTMALRGTPPNAPIAANSRQMVHGLTASLTGTM